jgi:Uma2 family endonuclease
MTVPAQTRRYTIDEYLTMERAATLEEYVLISQSSARVETFVRQPDRSWLYTAYDGLERIAKFRSIDVEVPLSEVYLNVALKTALPLDSAT